MIALAFMIAWFAAGAVGAFIGQRHMRRRFGDPGNLDVVIGMTIVMGPIGLAGAWFFVAADQRSEDIIAGRRKDD